MEGSGMVYRSRFWICFLVAFCLLFGVEIAVSPIAYAAENKTEISIDFGQVFLAEYEAILYDARSGL